jgi:GNAT superfamily N-acetyltransferase
VTDEARSAHPGGGLRVEPIAPGHESAFAALFEASASTCFCQFWHFEGNKNAWLARAAEEPDHNRRLHEALVAEKDARAGGLLAFERDIAVGWMKLTPRAVVPKLRRLPVYKALDLGEDEGIWSIGCFLVRPSHRGRGVARALLAAAEAHVLASGGHAIEAYPRHSLEPMHPEEAWMGPEAIFVRAGFTGVGGGDAWAAPYPVLRKTL